MSKYVKRIEMEYLNRQFSGIDELLVVDVVGIDANQSNQLRLDLRKKGIQLQVVKNSLARKMFDDIGLSEVGSLLDGSSCIAWGGEGIVELAKEITDWSKKLERFRIRGGWVEGQAIGASGVKQLSQIPSRDELLGRIAMLAMAPAGRIVSLANSAGAKIAGQLQAISESEGKEQ